ncbi:MAG: YceH family protein [Candidatus Delongbacteria bacterium]|nr:YceH family protein [Candidatus Delongbacteria bacterium]MBN2834423.1 YceH family protein [Candidatus Delongbacteria bacterium]
MEFNLTEIEIRVLGSLMEKERQTPEYYPVTLNYITNACNQKSNREPVSDYSQDEVYEALLSLKRKNLIWEVSIAGSARQPKYEHKINAAMNLTDAQFAIIAVLLLRGPQLPGEINSRTNRYYEFEDLAEVHRTLESLIDGEHGKLVIKLPIESGRKESKFMHLLSGTFDFESYKAKAEEEKEKEKNLVERVEYLEAELEKLKQMIIDFKGQFE